VKSEQITEKQVKCPICDEINTVIFKDGRPTQEYCYECGMYLFDLFEALGD